VNGEEIMQLFGLGPCAEVGKLKSAVKDAILDGLIPNEHDAALQYIMEQAAGMGIKPKAE
jgi:poly(A) polymerase